VTGDLRDRALNLIADAICGAGDRPPYSPAETCVAHKMQAAKAVDALLPLFAEVEANARRALGDTTPEVHGEDVDDYSMCLCGRPAADCPALGDTTPTDEGQP
jgi:hypothetical protein